MATKIPWVAMPGYKPETWEVVQGCTKVSEGCRNCYAERLAKGRLSRLYPEGFNKVVERNDRLMVPARWSKPRAVFVCSRSDLFHPAVSWDHINRVLREVIIQDQHRYFVLTKRPERVLEWATEHTLWATWPANAIAMTSAEDQATLDKRMGYLAQVPAPLRGLSLEPLLGPVNLGPWLAHMECPRCHRTDLVTRGGFSDDLLCPECGIYGQEKEPALSWVVVGGESGPDARPCDPDWIRSVVAQCCEAGIPVFVKQMGTAWAKSHRFDLLVEDWKGEDPSEWPSDLRIREWPTWR